MKHPLSSIVLCTLAVLTAAEASAATKYHRLTWDGDAAHSAVIGFSPDGTSTNPYVKYGYTTDEASWSTQQVTSTETFDGSLTSHFVRLDNLNANSPVYYQVCDQSGCGDRFWFKTAPDDNSSYVVVAGGDTRTGWTTRQQGNDLIAKIRPLVIMHGGDFTNADNASEMGSFLTDWTRTYSSDQIDGYSYKRIYPLVPTHGNHEDGNYSTICQVFGVDYNHDGQCNTSDTYGVVEVSPLLRIYTLNSQFMNSGYSSYATAMNNWLQSDLANNGSSATWRFAQYHKPMFPHYTGKSDNPTLFNWWAQNFYDYAMNLVVESDTHLTKLTQAVVPNGSDFATTTSGGTVYVGEGSWGAPARSANDPKSWTIDLASIQQYKVIQVSSDQAVVRTAQFDSSASTLTRDQRAADPLVLPGNVNWWVANEIGEAMTLVQSGGGRSVIDTGTGGGGGGTGGGEEISLAVTDDVFVSSTNASSNYNGSSEGLLADGDDSTYGELYTLIKFDLSSVSECTSFNSANLEVNVTNSSADSYQIYSAVNDWQEGSATWNSIGGSAQLGTLLASFTPSSTGVASIDLLSSGILSDWLANGNYGLVIAPNGGTDGVDMTSKESGQSPVLKVSSDCGTGGGSGGGGASGGSYSETGLSGARRSWQHFPVDIPAGMSQLTVNTSGGTGNVSLYLRAGQQPSSWSYDCRSRTSGNEESCTIDNPAAGTWYLSVYGNQAYTGVDLAAEWQ